ncbi:MAG: purine-binding chemotaxis protein CheW [Verrucomicrobia bacterium]|nr:purine-binding chemotaxis protein CheW [Verrucomicrobiota bacterium]
MTTQDLESYILFELGGTSYGVKSREVLHMEMLDQVTPVPNAPLFVDGVVFSRGQVIPIVNLRVRFGFPRQSHTLRTRLLVVQVDDRAVGLIVDSAREFRMIPAHVIQPPDAAISGLSGKFLTGIASMDDRLILLLDVQATLDLIETEAANTAGPAMAI